MGSWDGHYRERRRHPLKYYPEGFIYRIFCGRFPIAILDSERFYQASLLDVSCGYGRNIPFFQEVGFRINATEISEEILAPLRDTFPDVHFSVGCNGELPFPDDWFAYVVACQSCYYLDSDNAFSDTLSEIARVMVPKGKFIASIPGPHHSILDNAALDGNNVAVILSDRQNIREGMRMQIAGSESHLRDILHGFFDVGEIGHQVDEFCGFVRDIYYFCAEKRSLFPDRESIT